MSLVGEVLYAGGGAIPPPPLEMVLKVLTLGVRRWWWFGWGWTRCICTCMWCPLMGGGAVGYELYGLFGNMLDEVVRVRLWEYIGLPEWSTGGARWRAYCGSAIASPVSRSAEMDKNNVLE